MVKYNCFNLLYWNKYVKILLDENYLNYHLTKGASLLDISFQQWKTIDVTVRAWLFNNLKLEYVNKYIFFNTSKKIWDKVHKSYLH